MGMAEEVEVDVSWAVDGTSRLDYEEFMLEVEDSEAEFDLL